MYADVTWIGTSRSQPDRILSRLGVVSVARGVQRVAQEKPPLIPPNHFHAQCGAAPLHSPPPPSPPRARPPPDKIREQLRPRRHLKMLVQRRHIIMHCP